HRWYAPASDFLGSLRAAEPDAVAALGRRVLVAERRAHPRGVRPVPRAAPDHPLVARRGPLGRRLLVLAVLAVPVGHPLPDVAHDVLHAVARRTLREAADRGRVREAVVGLVHGLLLDAVLVPPGDALLAARVEVPGGRVVVAPRVLA